MNKKAKKSLLTLIITASLLCAIQCLIPNRLVLMEGEKYNAGPLFHSDFDANGKCQLKAFGIVPIKTVHIDFIKNTKLIPSGKTVGIKININGVLVVALSPVIGENGIRYSPAKVGGIKKGDVIIKINNTDISTISQLITQIKNNSNNNMTVLINRKGSMKSLTVKPAKSKNDNVYQIGAWVRESSSGIGTITYINPVDNTFGALGHGITDIDTGELIPANNGDILSTSIESVTKGMRGQPGELKGLFAPSSVIGRVEKNTDNGVFGALGKIIQNSPQPLPVASRAQVSTGNAYILSNIEGTTVKRYDVLIESVNKNDLGNKGIIIKITDDELINKTGGIVQGMSGCPIIQNDYIVGAVTHVFINDPIRGYATFLDVMINNNA